MKVEEIRTVGVVGAGSMGTGIIQVAAQSGSRRFARSSFSLRRARSLSVRVSIAEMTLVPADCRGARSVLRFLNTV